MSTRAQLRQMLKEGMVVAPFVFDAFTAKIAQSIGFRALYMTGNGTAARLGMTDVGLATLTEMVENLRSICAAVDLPVIADADTGYGNPINVTRTVREYERAGAAALHLEDQVFPKKCGFFEGKQVVPLEEHVQKIRAALDARQDPDFVIIARTDALAVHGWDETVRRAEAYYEAGADLVFVDGIKTLEDLDVYTDALVRRGVPCLYNGGLVSTQEAAARGFKIQITGGGHGIAYLAVRDALRELKRTGKGPQLSLRDDDFANITDLLGLPKIYEMERRYQVIPQSA
jgi:2-methylisocitrate lyase-like PEP mutase family enzyme